MVSEDGRGWRLEEAICWQSGETHGRMDVACYGVELYGYTDGKTCLHTHAVYNVRASIA